MSKKLKFIWIDDNPRRKGESVNLQNRLKVLVDFKDAKEHDVTVILSEITNGSEPDMIIIDHKLEGDEGIFKTGSSVAVVLREKWPECPIVCISAVDKSDVDSPQRLLYEEMFPITKISQYDGVLLSIAKNFKKVKNEKPTEVDDVLKLLKAPKDQQERLSSIIPKELKDNFHDTGLVSEISHWVRKVLIERPGFLYDRLWAATLIGVKEASFQKLEDLFKSAKYTGIFSDSSHERWWKSKLLSILSSKVVEYGLPWEKGRKLDGIEAKDYSKCIVSKEDFPETVAYIEENSTKRAPMKISNTIPHPLYEDLLFFEEIRMTKPADE